MKPFPLPALLCSLVLMTAVAAAHAQPLRPSVRATVQAAGSSDGALPFWLAANRFGLVDPEGAQALTRLSVRQPFAGTPGWDYTLMADVVARASDNPTAFVHQLYGSLRYAPFTLSVGWREETSGLVDPSLSVGSMLLSGNAATIPKVSLGVPDYTDIPGMFGLVAFKAYWAHGWLGGDRYVRNAFLHEKYLYLRGVGSEDFPFLGHAGITHYVTWGGTHPTLGPLPAGLDDYLDVVLGQAGDGGTAPIGEVLNALGNAIATYDFGITLNLPGLRATAYRQFFIETGPALRFRNPWDGLWGVSLRRTTPDRLVNGVLWEHVNTLRQGSKRSEGEPDGADSFYNNFIYQTGWTHRGRTLGLPLLFSDGSLTQPVINNIVVAHHFGMEGLIGGRAAYKAFLTYSRNYGARDDCNDQGCTGETDLLTGRLDHYALLFDVQHPLRPNLDVRAALAVDLGALYPNRAGVMVAVSWHSIGRP